MRIKTVPHTLIRGRIYYYNLRFQEHFVRISLKTSQAHIAFQCVIKINDFLLAYKQLGLLTKELVVSVVKKVRDKIAKSVNAYLGLDSTTHNEVLDSYSTYCAEAEQDYRNSKLFYPPEEISHLKPKTFEEYQLDKVFPHDKKAAELAQSSVESDFMLENDLSATSPYIDDIIYENSKAQSWIKDVNQLTQLFNSAKKIRSYLESGEQALAIELLGAVTGEYVGKKPIKRLKPFSEYSEMFLEAGIEGNLSAIKGEGARKPWRHDVKVGNSKYMRFVSEYFKGKSLDQIGGEELDDLFSILIVNSPHQGKKPFRGMSLEELVSVTLDDQVGSQFMIKAKTVDNYKKLIQGFIGTCSTNGSCQKIHLKK